MKNSAEFQNEVTAAQGRGLSYNAAFNKVCRTRPDLVQKMKRSAIFTPGVTRGRRNAAGFTNAADDMVFGRSVGSALPKPLLSFLGVNATTSDADVITKIKAITTAPIALAAQLWTFLVNRLVWANQISGAEAQEKAKALFPKLAQICGC